MANRKKEAKQARLDARAQQIRRQAERESRTRNIIIAAFAVLILGGAGTLYVLANPPSFLTGNSAAAAATAPYSVPDEGHNHVPDGSRTGYKHQPPSSGPHYSSAGAPRPWAPYRDPVPAGAFVHNLEHGGVVLVYRCSGSECDDLYKKAQDLFSKLPQHLAPVHPQSSSVQQVREVKFLSTPYQDMTPKIALLAWTEEQELNSIDAKTVLDFYNKFSEHGREDLP